MVALENLTAARKRALRTALSAGFQELGFIVDVDLESSNLPGRYRLYAISNDFEELADAERQDMLWRVIKERWQRADQLRLTLTLALTKDEAGVNGDPTSRRRSSKSSRRSAARRFHGAPRR